MAAYDGVNAPTLSVQFYFNGSWHGVAPSQAKEISIRRGRPRPDQNNEAGQMVVLLDNVTGWFDPEYTASDSPYVVGGVNQLKAGLKGRLRATWDGVTYTTFYGYLETSKLDYGFYPTAAMTFTDATALLGKVVAKDLADAAYGGETTATRVNRMLTLAGWSDGTNVGGTIQMLPTLQGASTLAIINECAVSEAGRFYIATNGDATFLPLSDKFSRPTRLYLSDDRAPLTVEYDTIDATPGTYQVINECYINRPSRSKRRARYKPSVTAYGLKSMEITAPIQSATVADKVALYYARKDAIPTTVVESIGFQALALGTLWVDFLQLELGDQMTVQRTTVDGRTLVLNTVVEGYNQVITQDSWRCDIWTSPMNPYRITP